VVCDWGAPADNEDGSLASDDAPDKNKELTEMKALEIDKGKGAGLANEVERNGVDVAAGLSCDIAANGAMTDAGKRLRVDEASPVDASGSSFSSFSSSQSLPPSPFPLS
jgi:hypothetical protein